MTNRSPAACDFPTPAPPETIGPNASIVHAARAAAKAHVRRLPVIDDQGVLVGIVTRSDLLRVFLRGDAEIRVHITEEILTPRFCTDASSPCTTEL